MVSLGMSYQIETLVEAGMQQSAVATVSGDVGRILGGHDLRLATIGDVPAAAGFHRAVVHVATRQAKDADAEAARRAGLAVRAGRSATLGDELVSVTAEKAGSVSAATPR